ncbi:hypothetical protein EVJ50_11265 [Synechococcus sp. RSCCF101]|nr:hypothetical protein EVJ50_11265 [Synechococcus sp. RSCCF101]
MAYANLTIGLLGFSSFLRRSREFLLASMLAYGSWFFADGVGHLVSLLTAGDTAPSNSGSVLITDLGTPLLVLLLLQLSRRTRHRLH